MTFRSSVHVWNAHIVFRRCKLKLLRYFLEDSLFLLALCSGDVSGKRAKRHSWHHHCSEVRDRALEDKQIVEIVRQHLISLFIKEPSVIRHLRRPAGRLLGTARR